MKTEFDVPEELQNIISDAVGMIRLRDEYAKKRNGYKNARKCAKEHQRLKDKFWLKIYEMYPQANSDDCYYRNGKILIEPKGDDNTKEEN